jgi:hypothetical protein
MKYRDTKPSPEKYHCFLFSVCLLYSSMLTKDDIQPIADLILASEQRIRKDMATRQDLKAMAMKEDIKGMATKADLKKMATKEDVGDLKEYITLNNSVISTIFKVELHTAVNGLAKAIKTALQDTISHINTKEQQQDKKLENHDNRITSLELSRKN